MLRNLESTKGLITAEAVMMGLVCLSLVDMKHLKLCIHCVKAHDSKTSLYDI